MLRNDTCYYEHEEHCVYEGTCPHRDDEGKCLASDDDLLTYEDYLQEKEIRSLSGKAKDNE